MCYSLPELISYISSVINPGIHLWDVIAKGAHSPFVDDVQVPDVYWNLTSERVVTMEYVPGVKINNIPEIEKRGIDRGLLAKRSAEAYLTQLCRHGFFHCDPHPGTYSSC